MMWLDMLMMWIAVRGGLTQRHLWLAGTALGEFFERCAP